MDLRTFVAETLTQIVDGVADAKARLASGETGAKINPAYATLDVRPVEFDVAVTVAQQHDEAAAVKGEIKGGVLSVFQAKVGTDLETKAGSHSEQVSRVRFSVMLAQPGEVRPRAPVQSPPRGRGRHD